MAKTSRRSCERSERLGTPLKLFEFESLITMPQGNSWLYAPSPDGQRFLVSMRAESGAPTIQVITNWLKAARGVVK